MYRILLTVAVAGVLAAGTPGFRTHELATGLAGGYQVVAFDVNRDGRMDLIALASRMDDLIWFENPGAADKPWERRTLARGLKRMINLAACPAVDEIVVAHEFANVPKQSIGIVSVLTPGANRSEPWTVKEIDRLTTSHRLRCADPFGTGTVVVNAPLAGAQADAPDYRDHIPLVFYRPGEWKRVTIDSESEGVMHGIFVTPWSSKRDSVLTASFLGVHEYAAGKDGKWTRREVAKGNPEEWPRSGSSDIAVGHAGRQRFLAAIEPWHGNQVVVYTPAGKLWTRTRIDDSLVDGHTIATADFDGDGTDEIVAGYRGKGTSVHVYAREKQGSWKRTVLDDSIAAAACAVADLNEDRRIDVACIGSATANLRWYENLAR